MSEQTLPFATYAENVRWAAKHKKMFIRDLADRIEYGYEHVRQIWKGLSLNVSKDCNRLICEALNLPQDEMYRILENQKFAKKHGYRPAPVTDPREQQLHEVWSELDPDQQEIGLRMLKSLALERLAAAS